MRITNGTGLPALNEASGVQAADAPAAPARAAPAVQRASDAGMLKLCRTELQKLPEVDAARVAEIEAALLDGRITFDADRLAAQITRYHGGSQ